MGAIAEALVAYAQPLLDETDGSADRMSNAFALAQICWNLALLPDKDRDAEIAGMRPTLNMNVDKFEEFRRSVIQPMIRRHHEMFPHMPRLGAPARSKGVSATEPPPPPLPSRTEKYPGTGRNAPCPCKSGKKYKRCCGG